MLWIVATPLGNPGDLSPRAAEILSRVDIVLAEDTRRAGLVFQRCGVQARSFMSFHEHNEVERQAQVLAELKSGKELALISDAGTPLMADPGYRLVRACRAAGLPVSPVPGPSAPLAALCASGLPPQPFSFLGFLPRKGVDQQKLFDSFAKTKSTLVFFERKDRLKESLQSAFESLGARELCIARELTKTHEEFILSRLENWSELPDDFLGEITVIIGPPEEGGRIGEPELLIIIQKARSEQNNKDLKPRDLAKELKEQAPGWTVKELYELIQRSQRN